MSVHATLTDCASDSTPSLFLRLPAVQVISIDGDHTDAGMAADWASFRHLAHRGSLIFADDIQSLLVPRFRPGLAVDKEVHPLFAANADLQLVGCARLAGHADEWADEGMLAAKGTRPFPSHLVGHPERRHPYRPGGWRNVTRREARGKGLVQGLLPVRPLPASGGLCVARFVPRVDAHGGV